MRHRLVCLDAGYTLLAPRRTLGDALRGVLAEHGASVTEEQLRHAGAAADDWFWEIYHQPMSDIWTDDARIDDTWRHYHAVMLGDLGLEHLHPALIERILAAQYAPDSWELYPDVLPTVRALRQAGLRLGILSDWGSNLLPIVEGLGLARELDFVIASAAVGLAKPDPAFFALGAARVGVPPTEALMVGDSIVADIEGARSAGMEGILIRRPEWRDRRRPVPDGMPVIASLGELPAIVLGEG